MLNVVVLAAQHRPNAATGIVRAVVHRNRPIHHGTDTLAHAPRRMRLHVPDGREDLQHVSARDLGDRLVADAREGVALKAAQPRSAVLRITPSGLLLLDDKRGGSGEGRQGLRAAPRRQGVAARAGQLAVGEGDGAGLGERDQIYAAESEFPLPAADGETLGEIVVRGNVVMKGYYDDPDATARAMRGGWFRSGDAAVVHPDGYVEIRDRFKDVIISGGENISSIEVEGVMMRHPAVQEIAVVGMPDEKWGESPHAFVVLAADASAGAAELTAYAREQMAHFKTPRSFTFVDQLPKTATGKIQKYVLRGGRRAIATQ